ncbi:CDK2-associated and cullin domain-containing protein 1, variant 2 [Balamuthia mandrillaris]
MARSFSCIFFFCKVCTRPQTNHVFLRLKKTVVSNVSHQTLFFMFCLPSRFAVSYEAEHWPIISSAVAQVLQDPSTVVEQETLYRTVYNVCCQRHTVLLFANFVELLEQYLSCLREELCALLDSRELLPTFTSLFLRYLKSVDIICVGFRYLDRIYLKEKQNTSLKQVCNKAIHHVLFGHDELRKQLEELIAQLTPGPNPSLTMSLAKGLFELDKELAGLNPSLFFLYIPCLWPTQGPTEELQETKALLAQLQEQHHNTATCHNSLKRKWDEAETT